MERVDLVQFNDALVREIRACLADIASEMGERVKKTEATLKDFPKVYINMACRAVVYGYARSSLALSKSLSPPLRSWILFSTLANCPTVYLIVGQHAQNDLDAIRGTFR